MIKTNAAIKLKDGNTLCIEDAKTINYNMLSQQYVVRDEEDKIILLIDGSVVEFVGLHKYEAPASGWIPIAERKPELNEKVLACGIRGDIFIGKRADQLGENRFADVYNSMSTIVAAWMPLPEVYKGAVENGN